MTTSAAESARIEPMVRITGLHKEFGPLHILKGIDLDVAPGEVCVLLGPSGSGKSTLLRCINQLETFEAGEVWVGGEVLSVLKDLAREGMTMIVVTHEMGFAREVADHVVFMDGGVVVEAGSPDDVINHPKSERLQGFINSVL